MPMLEKENPPLYNPTFSPLVRGTDSGQRELSQHQGYNISEGLLPLLLTCSFQGEMGSGKMESPEHFPCFLL